jgi:hypothetical protein
MVEKRRISNHTPAVGTIFLRKVVFFEQKSPEYREKVLFEMIKVTYVWNPAQNQLEWF